MGSKSRLTKEERAVFKPHWPQGVQAGELLRVACDDKGRNGGSWLSVYIANDGDVHVGMQDWENVPEGQPSTLPSIRVRTLYGGGRNLHTRQALLWLARAIQLDNAENARPSDSVSPRTGEAKGMETGST